jgi:hypothetical protein
MSGFLAILWREFELLLNAVGTLHTDHGIHGFPLPAGHENRTGR